jgi:phosphoribosylformylglycinamidine synthase
MSRQLQNQQKPRVFRVVVESQLAFRGRSLQKQLQNFGLNSIKLPKVSDLFFLEGKLTHKEIAVLTETLICDPITQSYKSVELDLYNIVTVLSGQDSKVVEVTLRPGVTDNVAVELMQAVKRMGISGLEAAITGTRYEFSGGLSDEDIHLIAKQFLVNDTIQRYKLGEIQPEFMHPSESVKIAEIIPVRKASAEELVEISNGRRLALNQIEMKEIQRYFIAEVREPTDAELETLAQTWSEHCVHKTFKAQVRLNDGREIDGIIIRIR